MKRSLLLVCALAFALSAEAGSISVDTFRYAGPYPVKTPFMVDSVNVNSKKFEAKSFLDAPLSKEGLKDARILDAASLPGYEAGYALHWAAFSIQNSSYADVKISVEGLDDFVLYVDGSKQGPSLGLAPATHEVAIKYLSTAGKTPSVKVSVEAEDGKVSVNAGGKHYYGVKDVLLGTRFSGVSLSPDGKYMITSYTTTFEGGRTSSMTKLTETATGRLVAERQDRISWMPKSNKYYFTRKNAAGTDLVTVNPASGEESVMARGIPDGQFRIAPSEDFLIYTMVQNGPKERDNIYQILTPDDRQPGWRDRSYVSMYDLETGVMQQLTYGFHNTRIRDISKDGRYALVSVSEERLTKRPTSLVTLYLMDLKTLEMEVLVDKDGFMGGSTFSPDGKQILLTGSPEAFDGVGMNVAKGQTPNTYDYQLYIMDIATRKIRPMTKNFNPSVQSTLWNSGDGKVYFTAENRDMLSLYRMDPKSGKIEQLPAEEDMVERFSVASEAPILAYLGQGAMNSDRLYVMSLDTKKSTLREDLSAERLKDVELGECHEWNFKNSKGETVCGRYYLPPHFDPSKKYPMIVNYYGGCSPTGRNFESRYPHNAYAALGYVVYVVAGPSGATGFGQEWSARHVNTAGEGPAQDIIEGTMKFCKEHSFVNDKKVGCIGASYGGFMSQYIPTLTDFFAASVSHAGISDHTSYWGFGYWGYSYSETSMANSYPWSDQDLYVKQSPLYRADKINTPILFVHGDADTNVPFNESVQMFTALKLLGKETAFVAVSDQDHHILEYQKFIDWQNTIWAWFAKWLQDDPTWWDSIYAPKSL